ncbi:MAG: LptE family protein [Bacteroidales bacterium]|nr:LptE family protein [Candidatus Cacconaster equi]MCQ2157030.1 LPS assembly lipoprotein LptE [Bacteroidales bacterium]
MKRILIIIAAAVCLSSCGIYSFSGTSIQPDVQTITINFIEYKAQRVNPSLSNDLTEALKERFRKMTRLEQVEMDGDMEITGSIVGYDVAASSVTANEIAASNRLTVTVSLSFQDRKYPEEDFENKSFSAYSEYNSENSLDAVESSLCQEIVDKLVEDIFNACVAQW